MDYKFLNNSIDIEHIILPESDKINHCIKKNCESEILKAINFLSSENKMLQIHGFIGTGKRQFINYLGEFLDKNVVKLEYYCKASTVCDDILISFISELEKNSVSKPINPSSKITTLNVKFQQYLFALKKPVLVILHTADDIDDKNTTLVNNWINKLFENDNVKIVISTKSMLSNITHNINDIQKIFIKAFTIDVFKEYISDSKLSCSDKQFEDFYNCTHGYYYYTALSIKIAHAMKLTINDFLAKYRESGMKLEEFLCTMYLNLLPAAIRNFFWFLKTIRHGITLNALAVLEIYDDFSVEFLKSNLMIFQADETLYVQDLFYQKTDLSIPDKIQIRLHKYIINIYESQLKENLNSRLIHISRQALRSEIEYHNECIESIQHKDIPSQNNTGEENEQVMATDTTQTIKQTPENVIKESNLYAKDKNYTKAIEVLQNYTGNNNDISSQALVEIRLLLAHLYKEISDYSMSSYYYDLVEAYYMHSNESINLNYLYYDLSDLYIKMYKIERAIEIIKKVIYSGDTPPSLLVNACIRLGNIYSENKDNENAFVYYKKALDSVNNNIEQDALRELYFKYALACDDKGDTETAMEYYNKCISIGGENIYKTSAYSNIASCYFEKDNYDDALHCFSIAYNIEKNHNNYEGIYYNAAHIAEIYIKEHSDEALKYLKEAKQCAEFINEEDYILNSSLALGDFYYNKPGEYQKALTEYYKALNIAKNMPDNFNISKIESRIQDMKLRMNKQDYIEIENKYAK